MHRRCVFILPYFGGFRNYFPLFLRSCGKNPEYDWIILTDQLVDGAPPNVRVIGTSFEEFRDRLQSRFSFPISLETPYKLCDFKPAYGYLLEDEVAGYDYWGHCDCDLLFGRMALFLEPLFEEKYDKLFAAGHLTVYRNSPENNRRFMKTSPDGTCMHRIALSHPGTFAFDEMCWKRNVHTLFVGDGARVFSGDLSFNVSTRYWGIRREFFDPDDSRWKTAGSPARLLEWDDGVVRSIEAGQKASREWLYVHLQGRKFEFDPEVLAAPVVRIGPDTLQAEDKKAAGKAARSAGYSPESVRRALHRLKGGLRRDDPLDHDPYAPFAQGGGES